MCELALALVAGVIFHLTLNPTSDSEAPMEPLMYSIVGIVVIGVIAFLLPTKKND